MEQDLSLGQIISSSISSEQIHLLTKKPELLFIGRKYEVVEYKKDWLSKVENHLY